MQYAAEDYKEVENRGYVAAFFAEAVKYCADSVGYKVENFFATGIVGENSVNKLYPFHKSANASEEEERQCAGTRVCTDNGADIGNEGNLSAALFLNYIREKLCVILAVTV